MTWRGRLGEDWSHAGSDRDAVLEGIAFGPELARHGLMMMTTPGADPSRGR